MDRVDFPFEIKSLDASGRIEGVISSFGGIDAYGDTIEPGAYTKSLNRLAATQRKLPVLFAHDPARPIGVWSELKQAGDGLRGIADLTMEVPDARSAHALAKAGALSGISIGFSVPPGGSRMDGNLRVLSDIDLMEASLVTFPADPNARVSRVKALATPADFEEVFRERGLSGRQAKAAASAAWKSINHADGEDAADAAARAILNASAARIAAI